MSRRLILLGAGASVEAGVPDAKRLAPDLYEAVRSTAEREARAIRVALGGLQFGHAVVREDPFGQVDVEDLYETLLMLGRRRESTLGPFVSSWLPEVAATDQADSEESSAVVARHLHEVFHRSITSLTQSGHQNGGRRDPVGPSSGDLEGFRQALAEALRAAAVAPSESSVFSAAAAMLLDLLNTRAWVGDAEKVSYLRPLVASSRTVPLCIASLNYDNCIELAAEAEGVEVDDGVRDGRIDPEFRDSAPVWLVKVHGSLRWTYERDTNAIFVQPRGPAVRPALIFGGNNKLRVEGPYLDLLLAFRAQLRQATTLTVIGYSFRDRHVNHLVLSWLTDDVARQVVVFDPKLTVDAICDNIELANEAKLSRPALAARLRVECAKASEALRALVAASAGYERSGAPSG